MRLAPSTPTWRSFPLPYPLRAAFRVARIRPRLLLQPRRWAGIILRSLSRTFPDHPRIWGDPPTPSTSAAGLAPPGASSAAASSGASPALPVAPTPAAAAPLSTADILAPDTFARGNPWEGLASDMPTADPWVMLNIQATQANWAELHALSKGRSAKPRAPALALTCRTPPSVRGHAISSIVRSGRRRRSLRLFF